MKTTTILIAAALVAALGCRDGGSGQRAPDHAHEEGKQHGDGEEHHDEIRMSAEQLAEHGISLAVAGPGTVDVAIELSGVIRPNGDHLAHIVPRFPGMVREVKRTVGDPVQAGDVLAIVESSSSLARYQLQTMIAGVVLERHVTLGDAVGSETQAFVVADLRDVWADLSLFQRDLARVRIGQTVRVSAKSFAEGERTTDGKISYIAPIVDDATRTAVARTVLPNPSGSWRPGMFVAARVLDPQNAPVVVPEAAIQTVEGRAAVFVAKEEELEVRPVVLGRRGETQSEVVSGLEAGERFAATGTFLLKAELGKGAAEHEH